MPEAVARSLAGTLDRATARLAAAGVPGPRRDASLLLIHAAGLSRVALLTEPGRTLSPARAAAFEGLIERRAGREPVSRLLGRREFWSLDFVLTPDCLDPRPDSETLVAAVLERVTERSAPLRLLDLGTGSGCLLLALLSELPRATGLGTDIAEGAVRAARDNARALALEERACFVVADWGAGLGGSFDAVVCNPPYVAEAEFAALAPEVRRHEPRRALAGGDDGLAAYRAMAPALSRLARPGGIVALELGAGQSEAVTALLQAAGLVVEGVREDLSGTPRCLLSTPGISRMSRQKIGWKEPATGIGSAVRSASVRLVSG